MNNPLCNKQFHFYTSDPKDFNVSYKVNGFADASVKAYRCYIYLKFITKVTLILLR